MQFLVSICLEFLFVVLQPVLCLYCNNTKYRTFKMPVFSLDLTWEFLSRVILASVLSSNVTCFACFVLSFAPVSVSSVLLPEIPSESFWAQGMTIGAVCVDRFSVSSLSKFSLRLTEVPKMSHVIS